MPSNTTIAVPEVSVIIINYNTFELTCQCLQSVIKNTSDLNYEIILVDNASHEREPNDFRSIFPELILIKSNLNLGFAGGNNLGIKVAKGKVILLLNSDTILKNNAIGISYKRLKSLSKIGALSCKLLYPDERVQPVAGRFPSLKTELRNLLRLNKNLTKQQRVKIFLGTEFDYETECEVDWVWGTFFMFPKELLEHFENKLLPQDYFMYMEDVLWCYRIHQMGYKIYYIPQGEVYHLVAGSSNENGEGLERYRKKILPNEYDFIVKMKGYGYAKLYYLIKALHHLSLRTSENIKKSKMFFTYFFR